MAPPASSSSWSSRAAVHANLTVVVDDTDALDCGVCCLPLKPPIFQCAVGHVVCSPCLSKMVPANSCYVCRSPTKGAYRRCHAMERVVESVRVLCPNAAYGCAARPVYRDHRSHLRACPHAPCHCPEEGCGFAGSTEALLGHITCEHRRPSAKLRTQEWGQLILLHGFNVVDLLDDAGGKHLFLMVVSSERFGRTISTVRVRPRAVDDDDLINCKLELQTLHENHGDRNICLYHRQEAVFRVACTDLSSGLPDPDDCFHFFVPKYVETEDGPVNIFVEACFTLF